MGGCCVSHAENEFAEHTIKQTANVDVKCDSEDKIEKQWIHCECINIEPLESNYRLFTFVCLNNETLIFECGQHLFIRYMIDNNKNPNSMNENDLLYSPNMPFGCVFSVASSPKLLPQFKLLIENDTNKMSSKYHICNYTETDLRNKEESKKLYIWVEKYGYGTAIFKPEMVLSPIGKGNICIINSGTAVVASMSILDELLRHSKSNEIDMIHWIHSYRIESKNYQNIPFYKEVLGFKQKLKDKHSSMTFNPYYVCTGTKTDDNININDTSTDDIKHIKHMKQINTDHDIKLRNQRIDKEFIKQFVAGTRLFYLFGRSSFVQAMCDILIECGVWPGNIRSDYTTRVDPSNELLSGAITSQENPKENEKENGKENGKEKMEIEMKLAIPVTEAEASTPTRSRPGTPRMDYDFQKEVENKYIEINGIDILFNTLTKELLNDKPKNPLLYLTNKFEQLSQNLPVISNTDSLDPNFWINYWESDQVTWQSPFISPWLFDFKQDFIDFNDINDNNNNNNKCTVFVPLCGKALDMKALLDWGCKVIGCDCSGIACIDFFKKHKIKRKQSAISSNNDNNDNIINNNSNNNKNSIICHKSEDLNYDLQLYECDIFDLNSEIIGCQVDYILDRAALVALHPSCIENKYMPMLLNLLKNDGKMILASLSQLPTETAPPHVYTHKQMTQLMSKFFDEIKFLKNHSYTLNAGTVVEPIFLLEKPKILI